MTELNTELIRYGINFPLREIQFGRSVHVLDLNVFLNEINVIHYRGYTKPTDSKRYLNPNSFHPRSVFNSVPFSQMLRTLRNNSTEESKDIELKQCISHFEASGYNPAKLIELKDKAVNMTNAVNIIPATEERDTLVLPVHFFDGVAEFKSMVRSLNNEIQQLIGDTRIMFAFKKQFYRK